MLTANCALCIAHPGHELLIHGWLQQAQPLVFILTDGSGYAEQPRLEYSRRLLEPMGVRMARGCGRFSDKQVYELIIQGRVDLLVSLAMDFAMQLVDHRVDYVVADAAEGYNPVHDLSRVLSGVACDLARRTGLEITQYEFAIADPVPRHVGSAEIRCQLSEEQLQKKIAAARNYSPLRAEIDQQLTVRQEALGLEVLRPIADWRAPPSCALPPRYEAFGEQRVRKGCYDTVIRYGQHMAPLQQQLSDWLAAKTHHAPAKTHYR